MVKHEFSFYDNLLSSNQVGQKIEIIIPGMELTQEGFKAFTEDQINAIQEANNPSALNVFATIKDLPEIELTADQLAAIQGANAPTRSNVFVTINDLTLSETIDREIYISPTGNDEFGDGTQQKPYLTFAKAISTIKSIIRSNVMVTIYLDAGNYNLTSEDLFYLSCIEGGSINIIGTMILKDSGFVQGAADPNDPLTYTVSGGNTGSWTDNQYACCFARRGNSYYPITHNTSTSISFSYATTGITEIYEAKSIINLTGDIMVRSTISFYNLTLTATGGIYIKSSLNGSVSFYSCLLIGDNNIWYVTDYSRLYANLSCFKNIALRPLTNKSHTQLFGCYLYLNSNAPIVFFHGYDYAALFNNVYENPNTGTNACAILLSCYSSNAQTINTYTKFVNCNVAFMIVYLFLPTLSPGPNTTKIIIKSVNYFFRYASIVSGNEYARAYIVLDNANIYGAPNIRWFFDSMYEFVNPIRGRIVYIKGIIYPEHESNIRYTWNNNTSGSIVVGKTNQNYHIEIDYIIIRGSLREKGTIILTNKSDSEIIRQNVFDNAGITFSKEISGTDIRLAYTVDASGNNATVIFTQIKRSMIIPLLI